MSKFRTLTKLCWNLVPITIGIGIWNLNNLEFNLQHITRKNLDKAKYDACIKNAINSRIYAYSWYLDAVADHWDVLVYGDYIAVMPLPWRRKFLIFYIYFPYWILELGIFNTIENENVNRMFYDYLINKYRKINLRLNIENNYDITYHKFFIKNQFQFLKMRTNYANIILHYKKDRKKELKKAEIFKLYTKTDKDIETFIQLFKNNVGTRIKKISDKDYQKLKKIMKLCIDNNFGELIHVFDINSQLVASGFFIKYRDSVSILVSSTDFKNRNNGANTFLIDKAIEKYCKDYEYFYFGGSSITTIASFFRSFGANNIDYYHFSKPFSPFS